MATPGRQPDPPVARTLFEKPYGFDFYQAVRLLHWLREHADRGTRPSEIVRFAARLALETPASEIYELTQPQPATPERPGRAPEMTVNFLGLTGISGARPGRSGVAGCGCVSS